MGNQKAFLTLAVGEVIVSVMGNWYGKLLLKLGGYNNVKIPLLRKHVVEKIIQLKGKSVRAFGTHLSPFTFWWQGWKIARGGYSSVNFEIVVNVVIFIVCNEIAVIGHFPSLLLVKWKDVWTTWVRTHWLLGNFKFWREKTALRGVSMSYYKFLNSLSSIMIIWKQLSWKPC